MIEAWRWFGPQDRVSLDDIRQAGASDVVTALHEFAPSVAWPVSAVAERKNLIENTPMGRTPLRWSIVESIPVPDPVKRLGKAAKQAIAVWTASLEAVARNGITTICYNFMPVLDWTRTDLEWLLPSGAQALRFDQARFAAFDIHILGRRGAERDYSEDIRTRARAAFEAMSASEREQLTSYIAAGLPGGTSDVLSLDAFRGRLELYRDIDANRLRQHLVEFLEVVTPIADALDVRLTLHPDDPPRPLFGLPRIVSSAEDYRVLFDRVPSRANGMCFCTGSLGVSPDNDLSEMARHFAKRIYFVHLRATRREADGSFYEADHLGGDVDMIAVLELLLEENRQRDEKRRIPFRPDHGHRMLDDLRKVTSPGYSAIGRLKGLAELRGAIRALETMAGGARADTVSRTSRVADRCPAPQPAELRDGKAASTSRDQ
jgi:mannonate dehydratase